MTVSNISPGGRALCARVVASNSGENGWRQWEPSQGGARRSPAKGFDLRRKADVLRPSKRRKKQRHSRGEMRSEHNGGASLAAFLLAVSTVTLLFVSPVEGQVGAPCTTDLDCLADTTHTCIIPPGATTGECSGEACNVTALPGALDACYGTTDLGEPLFCYTGFCEPCVDSPLSNCDAFAGDSADQVANCQRNCFDFFACTTNADCPYSDLALCKEGQCGECEVSAFPGAAGS